MPVKSFDTLIRAMADQRAQFPELELVIVGEGAERDALEAVVHDLDADEWVHLPGRVDQDTLASLYRSAWVLASASVAEGWGMTITEAAACGTPAVVTDIAGHRDAVIDGVSGVLARPGELGAAIAHVLADDGLRGRLGEGALARARALTWEDTALGTMGALVADAERRRPR
jgi:glycosyltransferase involved in cell wall biosynthesis